MKEKIEQAKLGSCLGSQPTHSAHVLFLTLSARNRKSAVEISLYGDSVPASDNFSF